MNRLIMMDLKFTNTVRPEFDSLALAKDLREARSRLGLTIKEVADVCGVPPTEAEHWFRLDGCNAAPSTEVWPKVKTALGIVGWDVVGESYQVDNSFEMAGRGYRENGLAPTLTANNCPWVVRMEGSP